MDSLTQIVLGAAVGEAVLGKKIGTRAMLWGAIAGTIPDLDVLFRLLQMISLPQKCTVDFRIPLCLVFYLRLYLAWVAHRIPQKETERHAERLDFALFPSACDASYA